MKKSMLIFANGVLAIALAGVGVLDAQTQPNMKDCCKTNAAQAKFCCDDCCKVDSNCELTADCPKDGEEQ